MPLTQSLEHGLHNERVCRYLRKKADFGDWVITTAFYSAKYFLEHKLFPLKLTIDGSEIECTDFNGYCKAKRDTSRLHHKFAILVEERLPEIAATFNQLKDLCFTARYVQYEYSRKISNKAVEDLEKIKKFCT